MRRFVLCALLFFTSCEILEEDLSGRDVKVIAPMDRTETSTGAVAFRWHAVHGATAYELCVVAPSFSETARLVADTLVEADTLAFPRSYGCTLVLEPGDYEWIVSAFNSAYETSTLPLHLTVTERAEGTILKTEEL